jgi:cytochrome c-type biogenesis protein
VVFVTLGATIGLLGGLAGGYQRLLAQAAGVVLVAMGLYLAGAFRLPGVRRVLAPVANTVDTVYYRERRLPSTYGGAAVAERPGYWRSFAVGAAFAVGWVPCITPVLGAILTLAYAAPQDGAGAFGSAGEAAVLLASYAAGMGLPFLLVGLMVDRAAPLLGQLRRLLPFMNVASGALLVAVGLLVFTNSVTQLNRFFDFLPYVDFR